MTAPLSGIKVIEIGTLIAAPFAARLMAEFGAEVIKIEAMGQGDPLRKWRKLHEGTSRRVWKIRVACNRPSLIGYAMMSGHRDTSHSRVPGTRPSFPIAGNSAMCSSSARIAGTNLWVAVGFSSALVRGDSVLNVKRKCPCFAASTT